MNITHLKTDSYVRACLREKKITRIVDVIIECPQCGFEITETDANFCPGCAANLAPLQHTCGGCGAHSLMLTGPYCVVCGHNHTEIEIYPVNYAQTIINHQAALQ